MILGYHVILGFYGFWLPNDPRGSGSDFVASWELARFGPATKVTSTKSVAGVPHDRRLRLAAKEALKYPPVVLNGVQARAVGRGFAEAVEAGGHPVYACSILPEHVHLVFGPLKCKVETVVPRFKQRATMRLIEEGIHPLADHAGPDGPPKVWARNGWTNYIDSEDEMERCIVYVEKNPIKEGKPLQRWPFVVAWR